MKILMLLSLILMPLYSLNIYARSGCEGKIVRIKNASSASVHVKTELEAGSITDGNTQPEATFEPGTENDNFITLGSPQAKDFGTKSSNSEHATYIFTASDPNNTANSCSWKVKYTAEDFGCFVENEGNIQSGSICYGNIKINYNPSSDNKQFTFEDK